MRRFSLLPLLLLALCAAAPLAVADEAEEAGEGALVEEVLDEPLEECEEVPLCEEEGEAAEEAEEAEAADAEAAESPQCVLRSAKGRAVLKKNRLKLTIGYTASEPTQATVQLEYGGGNLGAFERRLGRSGVLRFSKPTKRVGKRLFVRIDGGAGCPSRRLVLFPKLRPQR